LPVEGVDGFCLTIYEIVFTDLPFTNCLQENQAGESDIAAGFTLTLVVPA